MLSEKFPEKVEISQPEEQGLLEASFLREMVAIHYFKGAQEGRASEGGLVWWVFLIG
jgi:hypothetical protein